MSEEYCEVIITGPDADWLADFTRSLVDARLAACGQNIATIRSIYRWQGNIEDEREARVALHTRTSLVQAIVERANTEHPYDVPCVIALPILGGNPDYVAWIAQETKAPD
jgi:periplasmic divalent cation tolerance protein